MKNTIKQNWTSNDALVLQSIRLSTKDNSGVSILKILGTSDFVNHEVIALDSLKESIQKLAQVNLIFVQNNLFFLTDYCVMQINKYCTSKQVHKYQNQLLEMLVTVESGLDKLINIDFLTTDYYESAYMQYQNSSQ